MWHPVDTGRKLNVHKTFRRRPGRLLNLWCTFNLRPVSTGVLSDNIFWLYRIFERRNFNRTSQGRSKFKVFLTKVFDTWLCLQVKFYVKYDFLSTHKNWSFHAFLCSAYFSLPSPITLWNEMEWNFISFWKTHLLFTPEVNCNLLCNE